MQFDWSLQQLNLLYCERLGKYEEWNNNWYCFPESSHRHGREGAARTHELKHNLDPDVARNREYEAVTVRLRWMLIKYMNKNQIS